MSLQYGTAAPVAIVGNLNLDIRTSPIASSNAIMEDGETGIEMIHESVGGGGAATASAIAMMGGEAHFCCGIGDDERGRRLRDFMKGIGVHIHESIKPVATGLSIALTWDTHQRHFVSSLPNTRLLEESDVDLETLRRAGCRHLYRADAWFADRMLPSGNASLLRRAREAGMETSLDINWDPLWSHARDAERAAERISWLKGALPHVSFVHGNERELARFTGAPPGEQSAMALLRWGAGAVIIHKGAHGCAAVTANGIIEVPAVPVTRIVNEAGTGDVFTAAFLLTPDLPLEERLRACAAAAAQHLEGARSYIPRMDG
jgi:sugar/nucleoside kinase (ribokinase family)